MALQTLPGAQPEDLDADPNAAMQKEDQEFQFINLRELINKQLSRAVQDLHNSFSVAQDAATSYENQAAQLVQENRRLRKRLAAAGLLHGNREVAAGTGELFSSDATPDACGPLFGETPLQNEVLQFSPPLGSGAGQRPPPPNCVEAHGPSEPVPEMRLERPKTDKTAWEDEGAGSGTTGGAKEQNNRSGQRRENNEDVCAGDTGNTDSDLSVDVAVIGDQSAHEPIVDKMHEGHFTPVMPLQEPDLTSAGAPMATDLDIEDVQDMIIPKQDLPGKKLSLEARDPFAQDPLNKRLTGLDMNHTLSLEARQMYAIEAHQGNSIEAQQFQSLEAQAARTRAAASIIGTNVTDNSNIVNHRNPFIGITLFCAECGTRFTDEAMFCCICGKRRQDGPSIVGVEAKKQANKMAGRHPKTNRNVVGFNEKKNEQRDISVIQDGKTSQISSAGTADLAVVPYSSMQKAKTGSVISTMPKTLQSQGTYGGQASDGKTNGHKFEVLPVWDSSQHGNSHHKKIMKKEAARNKNKNDGENKAIGSMPAFGSSPSLTKDKPSKVDNSKGFTLEQRDFRDRLTKWFHIMNPNDPRRGFWDTSSLLLVLYDMGAIPFEFFDPPETFFTIMMMWVTRFFWTFDIFMSFLTGYVTHDGFIELRPRKIAARYAKSWLALDICIVLVDWMELVMSANSSLGFARMGKASRTFRIIRMLRLLRLARMREVLGLITERINSEKVVIIADILKTMTIILGLAHIIACVWYAVGTTSDDGDSWMDKAGYTRASIADRYFISLHWSIAQFAGGMDEVTPKCANERIFAISMFVLAFIVASVFVSAITSSMTQLNIIGSHQSQQVSTLRRYLHQNGISNKLAVRIQRNAQHALIEQLKILPESAVTLLNVVSEPLRVEIHLEMYAPVLNVHHFFAKYIEECPQVMRKVCHIATNIMMISAGDVIFSAGEIPSQPKMYIVCSGKLEYENERANTLVNVGEDHCISEASLWVEWMHRGSLMATSDCRLCVLDAKKFQHICGQFSHGSFDPEGYARDFVKTLNEEPVPSDLPFDFDSRHSDRNSGDWALKRRPLLQRHEEQGIQKRLRDLCGCCLPAQNARKLNKRQTTRLFDTRWTDD